MHVILHATGLLPVFHLINLADWSSFLHTADPTNALRFSPGKVIFQD